MRNGVRISNDKGMGHYTTVEVAHGDEWVDISNFVRSVDWTARVGEIVRVNLELLPPSLRGSGVLDDSTVAAFADHLRQRGYEVSDGPVLG